MLVCKFCNKECKNLNSLHNHERLCKLNPNRNASYLSKMVECFCDVCGKVFNSRAGLCGHVSRSHVNRDKQSYYGKLGASMGGFEAGTFRHSETTKDLLSIKACERLAKHSKYSKNVEYKPSVILESSYEVRVAEILDKLDIEWVKVRQGYKWNDNGKIRRYIPDFYLPKHNIFLDPKNDYLIKMDRRKIESAMEINDIVVVILSDRQINLEFIKTLVQ